MNEIELFWERFLQNTNRPKETKYFSSFHFELTEKWANILLNMVLEGKKRATCSSLASFAYEGIDKPKVGDLSIVTDWNGKPRCVIETTNVTILPYKDMTYDICKREGEDDSLESWREGHERFFRAEGEEMGYSFNEDLLVVFEDFQVVYKE